MDAPWKNHAVEACLHDIVQRPRRRNIMLTAHLKSTFSRIGARIQVRTVPQGDISPRVETVSDEHGETFELVVPHLGRGELNVTDVSTRRRRLVLEVDYGSMIRFVCSCEEGRHVVELEALEPLTAESERLLSGLGFPGEPRESGDRFSAA